MEIQITIAVFAGLLFWGPDTFAEQRLQQMSNTLKEPIARAIASLPTDTESICVATGPFFFNPDAMASDRELSDSDVLISLQHIPASGIFFLKDGAYAELLKDATVVAGVEGARRFQLPRGLGMFTFEGCQSLIFGGDEDSKKLDRLMERLRRDASMVQTINGHQALHFQEQSEDDVWRWLIVRPSPYELLLATDEEYLTNVLTRRAVLDKGRVARPDALSCFDGWNYVDKDAPFWAVRKYELGASAKDPTSAIGLHRSAPVRDRDSVGLTVSCGCDDHHDTPRVQLHYFTRSKNAYSFGIRLFSTWTLLPQEYDGLVKGNRSHPGTGGVTNWASRTWQNRRHIGYVAPSAAGHSRTDCRVAA